MKKVFITLFILITTFSLNAQKYFTKNATIVFQSKGPLETIEGTNKTTTSVIDSKTGAIAFSVLIKGFVFEKQLMQKHFNENYMQSDKYPKSEFKGTISNNASVKYTTNGTYSVTVTGKLTLHGVTKDVSTAGKITVAGEKVSATADFSIALADYGISTDRISKTVTISVKTGNMDKLK